MFLAKHTKHYIVISSREVLYPIYCTEYRVLPPEEGALALYYEVMGFKSIRSAEGLWLVYRPLRVLDNFGFPEINVN